MNSAVGSSLPRHAKQLSKKREQRGIKRKTRLFLMFKGMHPHTLVIVARGTCMALVQYTPRVRASRVCCFTSHGRKP